MALRTEIYLKSPTSEQLDAFTAWILFEVNPARVKQGMPLLNANDAAAYLKLSYEFANRFGRLASA